MKLSKVGESLSRVAGKIKFKVSKHSPELLMAGGVMALAGALYFAGTGTIKATEVLEEYQANKETIENAKTTAENSLEVVDYTIEDYKRDKFINIGKMTEQMALAYAPAIACTALSVTCFFAAYGILHKRNAVLLAACTALEEQFKSYRERVRRALGDEVEQKFYLGANDIQPYTVETEDGTEKEVKRVDSDFGTFPGPFSAFFDEHSSEWSRSPCANITILEARQNWANDKLRAQGHLFLNEVFDMLDIPRTPIGALYGWIWNGDGDNFVDFGIYDTEKPEPYRTAAEAFRKGNERSIMLVFNVDGIIYDKI